MVQVKTMTTMKHTRNSLRLDKALVKYPEKIDLCKVVAAPNRLDDIVKKVKLKIAEQDKKLYTIIFYEVPDAEEVS